jgi:hypothetical protein
LEGRRLVLRRRRPLLHLTLRFHDLEAPGGRRR